MTPDEYEAAFHRIDLPPTLQLYSGVIISDVRAFVDSSLKILRENKSKITKESVQSRLDHALELLQQL